MPRRKRNATGGFVYHVLNRAVGRATIFETAKDYAVFKKVREIIGRVRETRSALCNRSVSPLSTLNTSAGPRRRLAPCRSFRSAELLPIGRATTGG